MTCSASPDLDQLIAEFIEAAERGNAPDPAEWLARHPGHAAALAAFLDDLGNFGSFLGLPRGLGVERTTVFREPQSPAGPEVAPGEHVGGYELLGEVGHGGMGTVYRARLPGTTLVVALKQVREGGVCGEEATRRFRDEIKSVAGLRHPNVVPIYHVGEHAGRPFYTMALVEGGSLDRHVGRFRDDPRAAATLVVKVARAVHHAHQR